MNVSEPALFSRWAWFRRRRGRGIPTAEARLAADIGGNSSLSGQAYLPLQRACMLQRRQKLRAEDPDSLGRRRSTRVRIELPAYAQTTSGRKDVRLLNLSTTGAMLEGPSLPAAGLDVVMRCGATDAFGVVVWSRGGRCGIDFDDRLDPVEVERQRLVGMSSASSGISPEEELAARDWVEGRTR